MKCRENTAEADGTRPGFQGRPGRLLPKGGLGRPLFFNAAGHGAQDLSPASRARW